MGKRNNFKPSGVFMKAYTRTLEKAVNSKYEKSDFQCYSEYPSKFSLNCEDCPFCCSSDDCTNPYFEDGAGFDRTFEQWQEWFYDLTGEKDDRPKKMFVEKNEQTKEITEHIGQNAQAENQTNKTNVEKAVYQTPKEINGNYALGNIADVTQTNFNLFTKELEEKAKAKYEVEYTALDSNEPRTRYVRKVVDLLSIIKEWNKEAIEWNLIANGNTSKISFDFKDIYIKVYDPEEGVILFQDEYTLKSKGLKLAWIKDD